MFGSFLGHDTGNVFKFVCIFPEALDILEIDKCIVFLFRTVCDPGCTWDVSATCTGSDCRGGWYMLCAVGWLTMHICFRTIFGVGF